MSGRRTLVLALMGAMLAAAMNTAGAAMGAPTAHEPVALSFAVVELFTSEGCSSCPPAERLLADLATAADRQGHHVLTLEFHVDYWNSDGWTDPWSSAAWTERQERYERALGESSPYTPQMIVNGTHAFVGSDREAARHTIDAALLRPATARVSIRAAPATGGVRMEYEVAGAPAGALLCVAVVESGLVSHVTRGENAGNTLSHESVVRAFVSKPLAGHGTGSLLLDAPPPGGHPRRAIAFIQDPHSLAILGATSAGL
jgi:hypothetical protein